MSASTTTPPTESAPGSGPSAQDGHRELWVDGALAVLAALLALAAAAFVLELWDAKLHVPLSQLSGDVTDSFMVVKMLAAGSWFQNDLIGAPSGTAFEDYPFYWDVGQVLGIKALSIGFSDPAAIFNASYVLGFPAIAFNAFVALRWVGARRGPAVLAAVLFALLPFHFLRGQAHFYIAQYWAVPYSCALVYRLAAGQPLLALRAAGGNRLTRWLSPTTLATLAACVVSGVQFGYNAIFTLVLLALVTAIRFVTAPRVRTLAEPAVAIAVTGVCFALMLLPTLLYRLAHGTDELVAQRTPHEAELYGLKLSQLLLPIDGHRIGAFSDKAHEYATTAPPLGEGASTPALGLVLGVAFVVSFVVLIASALRARSAPAGEYDGMLRASGLGALLCFLLGTIGGGSSLFAYLVSAQLRGWGRISVFLAFFAAIALCAIVGWLLHAWRGGRRPAIAAALLLVVGVAGALDQTSKSFAPTYAANLASWQSDARFVREIERQVPNRAMILELPHVPFPESPPQNRATDFDLFRPMVHSDHLRWSYGAMKGRPSDWGAISLPGRPLKDVVPAAVAAGFAGVYVDTYHYADSGAATLDELRAASGEQPIQSADGRMAFVPLAAAAARLKDACAPAAIATARTEFIHPTTVNWGPGFYPQETDGTDTWHWAGPSARIDLSVPGDRPRALHGTFTLGASTAAATTVAVRGPGVTRDVAIKPGKRAKVRVNIAPRTGTTSIELSTAAPDEPADPRDLRMRVLNFELDRGDLSCAA